MLHCVIKEGTPMSDKVIRSCVDCVTQSCVSEDGRNPAFCPSRDFRLEGATALLAELDKPDVFDMVKKSAQAASRAFAAQMSRIEEIMNFARECGFTRLALHHVEMWSVRLELQPAYSVTMALRSMARCARLGLSPGPTWALTRAIPRPSSAIPSTRRSS